MLSLEILYPHPPNNDKNTEKDPSLHISISSDKKTKKLNTPLPTLPPDSTPTLPQKNPSSLCIVFQNVHGLPQHNQHPKNDSLRCFITDHQVDVYGMSEVNVAWHQVDFHK